MLRGAYLKSITTSMMVRTNDVVREATACAAEADAMKMLASMLIIPPTPGKPKPGIASSTSSSAIPTINSITADQPACPANMLPAKYKPKDSSPTVPKSPKPGTNSSATNPPIPSVRSMALAVVLAIILASFTW